MWPYPWTHVGTPSHLGHLDRVAATMPSQANAGAAQEAPDIGQRVLVGSTMKGLVRYGVHWRVSLGMVHPPNGHAI